MQNFTKDSERSPSNYFIDAMMVADLDQVLEIERKTFPSPWSRSNFLFELKQNRAAYNFVIRSRKKKGRIVGFTCTWILFGELKINNIAIRKEYRRTGLGSWLIRYVLELGLRKGCDTASLEVRASNEAAILMYEKLGFKASGLRKGYYSDNAEDALLMTLDLNEQTNSFQKDGHVKNFI